MNSLVELTNTDAPAIDMIRYDSEILPPSADWEAVLLEVQVTTHSLMGAVAYNPLRDLIE